MRVLHVMAGARDGGAESMMLNATLALAEAGVEQAAVTRPDSQARSETLARAGVSVVPASFDKVWRKPTERAIKDTIKSFAPDVVHYWMGRAGMFAPKRYRQRNLAWHGSYYKMSRFKHCAWHAGVTKDIARHIVVQGAPKEHVSVLATYAAIEETAPPVSRASLSTPEEAPVVLAVARARSRRSVETALSAATRLPGVHFWVLGAEPGEFAHELEKLNLADRVRLLGARTDRSGLMAASDVVAFASRSDPFGIAPAEAWAAGRPAIVAETHGAAPPINAEQNALLAPRDDAAALAAALRRVLEDAELARRLVENGRRTYQAGFTRAAFVRSAMSLYDRIARNARSERGA